MGCGRGEMVMRNAGLNLVVLCTGVWISAKRAGPPVNLRHFVKSDDFWLQIGPFFVHRRGG